MITAKASESLGNRPVDLADGIILAVVALWAVNNVFTKAALNDSVRPLVYVFLRFAIVAVLLFGWLGIRRRNVRIRKEDLRLFVINGISGYAAYNLLFVVGLSRTTAISAAILVGLAPLFTLLITAALGWERVRKWEWLGAGIAFTGVGIFLGNKVISGQPALGDVLNVVAAFSFLIYALATRDLVVRYGAPATTAWSVLIGLVAVLPITLPSVARQDWTELGWLGWGAVLYAAVVSMLISYTLWSWAIARKGAGRTVPYLFLIPVFTGLFSVLLLDDHLKPAQLAGGAIALVGVALARWSAVPVFAAGQRTR